MVMQLLLHPMALEIPPLSRSLYPLDPVILPKVLALSRLADVYLRTLGFPTRVMFGGPLVMVWSPRMATVAVLLLLVMVLLP